MGSMISGRFPKTIEDVVDNKLCTGCGACAAINPGRYEMIDVFEEGRRPKLLSTGAVSGEDISYCPGGGVNRSFLPEKDRSLNWTEAWGPARSIWVGFAADEQLRFEGSSGGAATALATYCLDALGYDGALHIGSSKGSSLTNSARISRTPGELRQNVGSRYAPASPCESLSQIADNDGSYVFIGKPCDSYAVSRLKQQKNDLGNSIRLNIAFFCAGTPSTKGTHELLQSHGIEPTDVGMLRYRGHGWPGSFYVSVGQTENGKDPSHSLSLTYDESWGFLESFRQWRCFVCPDHTGEFADIAVGDPWFRERSEAEPGRSIIVARTEVGERFVIDAIENGYLVAERADLTVIDRSQPNLRRTRAVLWPRLIIANLFGLKVPRISGYALRQTWLAELGFSEKTSSVKRSLSRVVKVATQRFLKRRPNE